jgi:SAM-dependent methyltransferase
LINGDSLAASTLAKEYALGIYQTELEFLLHEHRYRPITGKVLTLGRQAINIPADLLREILTAYGCVPRDDKPFEFAYDLKNKHGFGATPPITETSLFAAIGNCEVRSLDISDYEGADYVWDICGDSPKHLHGQFDLVIEGGSLDNVFDPARAMRNLCDLLKPGGRIFIFAWGNSYPSSYLKFSPDWLIDYFAVNEWADCKVYSAQFERSNVEGHLSAWHYDPFEYHGDQVGYESSHITTWCPSETICIAERGKRSTTQRSPIQKHYRGPATEPYNTSAVRFSFSPRPLFQSPFSIELCADIQSRKISPYATTHLVAKWPPRPWESDWHPIPW